MDPLRGASEFRARHRWLAALVLGAAGFVLNLYPVLLSPGTELLLGGTAALLAAVALGPGPGALAAGMAAAGSMDAWQHPYVLAILTLEGVAVGWLVHRFGRRALVADFIFWAALGVPLLMITYGWIMGVGGATAAVIFLKQPLNGLINALAAETLLLLPPLRRVLGVRGGPPLRAALAVVVALAGVLPTLGFGVWSGRREWDRNLERTSERLLLASEAHAARLADYVRLHSSAVRAAALPTAARARWDPALIERDLAGVQAAFPAFAVVFAGDASGRVVAVRRAPGLAARMKVGSDYSDREYVKEARRTRDGVVSEVILGRATGEPVVVIAYPLMVGDSVAGFMAGALPLRTIPAPIPAPALAERMRVADRGGVLLFDSRAPYRRGQTPRSVADSAAFRAVEGLPDRGTTTFEQQVEKRAPAAANEAHMLAGVARVPGLEWRVWTDEPYSDIQALVAESYVRLLALLIGVTLAALVLSNLLADYMAAPLLRIRRASAALGAGDLGARAGHLPDSAPNEIRALGRDFDRMAFALAGRAEELEELGEIARSLASTLDAGEVLRRVTDATARLVAPDGCGIALLAPDGATLTMAEHAVGLMARDPGFAIPADDSLAGWVAREGVAVLVRDAAHDSRVPSGSAELPDGVGSVICAPLVGRSGALGTLTAVRACGERPPFTDGDLRLLERLARHAAVAVENAHLVARERRRAEESEAIRTVARTVSAVQGLQETLAVVVREAARIVGAGACRVGLLYQNEEALEIVAVAGPSALAVGTVVPIEGELLEGPMWRGEPAAVTRDGNAASVPLRVADETLGVLTAHDRATPFGPEDMALLTAFADHAAIALRNAQLLEAAQEASRAKSDFLATMSHELRTPLNAVLGHLELLTLEIHGPITEKQGEALGRIESASRHLLGLIEEVLSFARLEAGRAEAHYEESDLCALASEVAAVIEPLATEKRLAFASDPCDPPVLISTDPEKVTQILINLAGNAVKFTEAGEVRIAVSTRGAEIVLAVSDTGPGIEPDDRERLFRPFEQLHSGFSRPHGGTGLGLYLSGQYAQLLGGRIEVESEIGRGSTFSLVLPVEPPLIPEGAAAAAERAAQS
ncbi:MAG TPA: ATP-binding protein [Longimicrobium sp.]|nr:ATP-binding protein [Longimicrobium sp.]